MNWCFECCLFLFLFSLRQEYVADCNRRHSHEILCRFTMSPPLVSLVRHSLGAHASLPRMIAPHASSTKHRKKGSLAAFVVCAMSTLLLFGSCCLLPDEGSDLRHGAASGGGRDSYDRSSNGSMLGGFSACAEMSGSDSRRRLLLQLWYALLGGVSGAVGEFLPLGVDDNLSMPIVSGGMFMFLALAGASGSSP